MKESKNIPEIRFEGFEGEWKEKKMSEVADFSKGHSYSKNDIVEVGTPIILYGRLYTKYQLTISEVDTFVVEKPGSIYSTGNEVIVPASGETAEDIAIGSAILEPGIIFGGDLNIIYPNSTIDSQFLALSISHSKQHKELSKKAQGKSIVHLRNADIMQTTLNYPSKKEQSQIGSYFQNLDKQITLEQQKHDKLGTLKKAMLEKMFPKEGARVPEIRFEGFEGEWEEKQFNNIAFYRNGRAHENDIEEKGEYIVVNSKFVSTNGEVKKYSNKQNEPLYLDEIVFVLSDVPNGRAIARTFLVDANDKYTLNQRIAAITPSEETDSYFLFILLNRNKYFLQFDDGAKQTNLSKVDVEIFSSYYPSKKEQSQIGSYFQNLDKLISLQQQKIDKLKNIKKACLEKMFV